jgi:phage baseplate assembly protein W
MNAASQPVWAGYGEQSDLGANWRIKFFDADGIPLNMLSFEQIDFGAIAYKEIFQNVKTILATPLYSAALERLLGIDQTIVDLPIGQASQATIAILDALYFWEPRVQVVNIEFASDVISGRLQCVLKLNITNTIFGTNTPYDRNNIFESPARIVQEMPAPPPEPPSSGDGNVILVEGPAGPAGPQGPTGATGATGPRGSIWFTGPNDPATGGGPSVGAQPNDMYLNTTTAAIFQYDGTSWRMIFNGMAK